MGTFKPAMPSPISEQQWVKINLHIFVLFVKALTNRCYNCAEQL